MDFVHSFRKDLLDFHSSVYEVYGEDRRMIEFLQPQGGDGELLIRVYWVHGAGEAAEKLWVRLVITGS